MNNVNHLRRLQFRTLVCLGKAVERRGHYIYVKHGLAYPGFKSIEATRNTEASEERWDRSLMEALANSLGTTDEILRFTERYGPLDARLKVGEKRNTRFDIGDWQKLQREYRATWDRLMLRRGRVVPPTARLPVVAGEEIFWWFDDLRFSAGSLYRLLLLELYSMPRAKLKKCRRAGCQVPYFVADHLSQRYCTTCRLEARLESKRKWWSENRSGAR